MHHLVFGINFQIHSVSLTILVSIHLIIHLSTHHCHHPHSCHSSLLHSFTPGSKPTFSTNPFHRRFLLGTRLPYDNRTGPDTFIILFLVSHFIFLFIPWGRLSWLPVSFLLHVKYTLSYRIVSLIIFINKANGSSMLYHFRDIWCWKLLWPWNPGQRSLTLRIYARSVHRWNLQFRAIFLPLIVGSVLIHCNTTSSGTGYSYRDMSLL